MSIDPVTMARIQRFADKIKEHNELTAGKEGQPLTAFVKTFGCQMNEHDSEKLKGMLARMGYSVVPDYQLSDSALIPDVVVFNTCCVRENADTRLQGQASAMVSAARVLCIRISSFFFILFCTPRK